MKTTIDLTELAVVYTAAVERPRRTVAEHFGISLNEASRHIGRARQHGVLTPYVATRRESATGSGLTAAQRDDVAAIFRGEVEGRTPCGSCGGLHLRACPRVKRREFHADGSLLVEEYWPPGTWESDAIIFPEAAFETDD